MQVLYYNCCWWLFWKCSISLFPLTLACYWNAPSSERDYIAAVTGCRGPSRNFGRTWSLVPFFRTVAAANVMTRLRSSYHMAIHIIIHFFFHLSFFPPCAVPTLLNEAKSQKGKKGKKRAVRDVHHKRGTLSRDRSSQGSWLTIESVVRHFRFEFGPRLISSRKQNSFVNDIFVFSRFYETLLVGGFSVFLKSFSIWPESFCLSSVT